MILTPSNNILSLFSRTISLAGVRASEGKKRCVCLYIVHLSRGFVVVVAKAGYGGHVVIVFALGPGIVGRVLVGVLLDVFCSMLASAA